MIDDVLLRAVCRALCDHVRHNTISSEAERHITRAIEDGALDFLPGVTRPCRKPEDPTARLNLPTLAGALVWSQRLAKQQKPIAETAPAETPHRSVIDRGAVAPTRKIKGVTVWSCLNCKTPTPFTAYVLAHQNTELVHTCSHCGHRHLAHRGHVTYYDSGEA